MLRHTYFISDLHLTADEPQITQAFLTFLTQYATQADALYILGDFFEAWIGDDNIDPFTQSITNALLSLSQSTPIYYMHGNRDFLVGKTFLKASNMTFLPDPTLITCYDCNILLSHGDSLCTDDTSYQRFRKWRSSRFIQQCFTALPLALRKKIGRYLRKKSKIHQQLTPNYFGDINPQALASTLQKHHLPTTIIHGHTHKPKKHKTTVDNQEITRYVLGSWEYSDKVILRLDEDQTFTLETLPL